jgi:hypothetical protein
VDHQPASEAGTGAVRDPEMVALEEVIAKINDLFSGDHPDSGVRNVVTHIPTDKPTRESPGRHQWALSKQVRLACAIRLGFITEDDFFRAQDLLEARLWELREETGETVPEFEFRGLMHHGIKRASCKTDEEARAELGGDANAADEKKPPLQLRDRLLKLSDLKNLVPPQPLVRGLIYQNTLTQVSGPPGSYKSFIAASVMCSLATGKPFSDFEVPRAGKVVYVAAEGASGINKRILAWCEHYKVDPEQLEENLLILPIPLQLGNGDQVKQMTDIVGEFGADLLVLDTRARCTVGLEENSATEQGIAIEAADSIRDATRCTAWGVHHSPKTGPGGRGSNTWDCAVWSDLRVAGELGIAKLKCEKHKDIPDGCNHNFAFTSHVVSQKLMPDDDLEGRSTLVLSGLSAGLLNMEMNSRDVVLDIIWTNALVDGFSATQIVGFAEKREIGRSTAYGALKVLAEQGRIVNVGTDKRPRYVADVARCKEWVDQNVQVSR